MNISVTNFKFIFGFFVLFLYTSPTYAYLDPGTGSILLQGLIGGIAASITFLSMYWHKVKAFFNKKKETKNLNNKD